MNKLIENSIYLVLEPNRERFLWLQDQLLNLNIAKGQIFWQQNLSAPYKCDPDFIFCSHDLFNGNTKPLESLLTRFPTQHILITSKEERISTASDYINAGAHAYLAYGSSNALQLLNILHGILERDKLHQQLKQTQKELSESTEQFRQLSKATTDIRYTWDLNNNEIHWHPTPGNRLGVSSSTKINFQAWHKMVHPKDKAGFIRYWDNVLSGEIEIKSENSYRIRTEGNSYILVRDSIVATPDEEGKVNRITGVLQDISTWIKAETHIGLSKEKYDLLFNKSPIPKLTCEPDTLQVLEINEAAIQFYGYSKKEFKKLRVYDLMPGGDIAALENTMQFLKGKESSMYLGEWTHRNSHQQNIIVELVGHHIAMNNESFIVFDCLDITEKVTSKVRLKDVNERYEYIFKATFDAIWDLDLKKNTLYWGESYQKIFGHKTENVHLNFSEWEKNIHPKDREEVLSGFHAAINSNAMEWSDSYRLKKQNGEYAYVEDKGLILRNKKNKAYRAIGALKDISDRKNWEQQLKLMESVVKNSNDAILITEGDQIDEPGPKIIFANEAFYKNTGYTPAEIIGSTPRILQGPNTDREALNKVRSAMEKGESCRVEVINYKKSGEEFWVEFSIVPVPFEGKTTFISIQRDVTERKEEEKKANLFRGINMAISKPNTLKKRYDIVLEAIAKYCDFELAEGWMTNLDNTKLNRITTYHSNQGLAAFFKDKPVFTQTSRGEGLPGKMWVEKELIIWEDLNRQEEFIRHKLAVQYGLNSAIAVPVFNEDQLLGGILLFSKKKQLQLNDMKQVLTELSVRFGAELQRMKSEEELQTFINLSPDILCVLNERGAVKKMNPACIQILEYSKAEIEFMTIYDILLSEDHTRAEELISNIISGSSQNYIESRFLTKQGKLIWLSLTFSYDPDEELIYAVGKNITEKKNLEVLLQKSNNLAKIGSWKVNLEDKKVYWSELAKEIHQVPNNYIPDLNSAFNFYEEGANREKIYSLFNQSINGQLDRWELEAKIITAKGNPKWVRVEAESEWENGKLVSLYGSIQDIHERKIAQNELREANLRYQLATEATGLGIWDWDIVQDSIKLDDMIYSLYGIKKGEFGGTYEELLTFLHADDVKMFDSQVKEAIKKKSSLVLTYRVVHPDQSVHYLRAHANIIKDSSNKPYRLVGINYDITNEIRQQEELEKASKERKDILESITDGFFAVDKDWKVTYWNAAAETIVSLPREKIIDKNLWEVFADVRDDIFYEALHESMRHNKAVNFDQYYKEAEIWTEVSCYPRRYGLAVYFKDITEQKKQEQKIIEMRNLQKHVINSTTDLIWAIDTEYRLILGNDAYFELMKSVSGVDYHIGQKVVSQTSQNWNFTDERKREWQEIYNNGLKGERIYHMIPVEIKGNIHQFQIAVHPIKKTDHKGNTVITGLACFSRDMTERLQYINAIEIQNDRLREIAWMQSHIVRAPVSRIMGLVDLLLDHDEEDEELLNDLLDHIMSSTKELDEIIHQISEKTEAIDLSVPPKMN